MSPSCGPLSSPPFNGGTITNKLVISGVTNDKSLQITGASLTGNNASSFLDIAGTWNTSGVATAFKVSITNTASGSGSLLADFQVGGQSYFSVNASAPGGVNVINVTNPNGTAGIGVNGSNELALGSGNGVCISALNGYVRWGNQTGSEVITRGDYTVPRFSIYPASNSGGGIVSVWNSAYNLTNYERFSTDWNTTSNVCSMGNEAGGTGVLRQWKLISPPRLPNYTVATLPSAATMGVGALAFVTDGSLTAILGLGTTVAGGGANKVPVYSDGTNWIVI